MTVQELITELGKWDPDWEVMVAQDPEGNYFHALYEVDPGYFNEYDEIRHPDDVEESREQGEEIDVTQKLILWP